MPENRTAEFPSARIIPAIILQEDVLVALSAVSPSLQSTAVSLQRICDNLNAAFHRLVTRMGESKPIKIDPNGAALVDMAAGCREALHPVAFRLKSLRDDGSGLDELATMIGESDDPVLFALMDATTISHGGEHASQRLAAAFAMVRALQGWAGAAGNQFVAGANAAEVARKAELKQQSFVFGTFVFAAYVDLTGNKIAISRGKQGGPDEGRPVGPLLRFTQTLYGQLRTRCAALPELADIAKQRALRPSADTVEVWVEKLRLAQGS